tara:strand:- start:2561 stop:2926 length:366 start_codon:yes stop_codon:yes gene_type:complete
MQAHQSKLKPKTPCVTNSRERRCHAGVEGNKMTITQAPNLGDTITNEAWSYDTKRSRRFEKPYYKTTITALESNVFSPWWDELPKRMMIWYEDDNYNNVFGFTHKTKSPTGLDIRLFVENK